MESERAWIIQERKCEREGERERTAISKSLREIVVNHGKQSTPMKKNGHQIPDRFFITSLRRVSASGLVEGKNERQAANEFLPSNGAKSPPGTVCLECREMNERLGRGIAKCFLKAFISQLSRTSTHFQTSQKRACDKKLINSLSFNSLLRIHIIKKK